jgi:hypothetical protein
MALAIVPLSVTFAEISRPSPDMTQPADAVIAPAGSKLSDLSALASPARTASVTAAASATSCNRHPLFVIVTASISGSMDEWPPEQWVNLSNEWPDWNALELRTPGARRRPRGRRDYPQRARSTVTQHRDARQPAHAPCELKEKLKE